MSKHENCDPILEGREPKIIELATHEWLKTHGAGPDRHETIAAISDWLDEGGDMLVEYQSPRPFGPITVTLRDRPPGKWRLVLDGLLPPECDTIRSHLIEEEWRDGPHPMHETCVVATLATILHGRGIRLDPRTVLYLHGETAVCGRSLPPYSRVSLADAVEEDGWDAVADYLVELQNDLLQRSPKLARRGPGRPRDDEFDQFVRERYLALYNVQQVAREASERFGGSVDTVAKRSYDGVRTTVSCNARRKTVDHPNDRPTE